MTDKMLAYIGYQEGEEWCIPVHGATRGKAKYNFMKWAPCVCDFDFRLVRLRRLPALDDKPFNTENLNASGWNYIDFETDEPISNDKFQNDCRCEICTKFYK